MTYSQSSYEFALKKNPRKVYEIVVKLYDHREEMINDFKKASISFPDAEGIFVPAQEKSTYVGSIRLAKDCLTVETIIHESMHAGIELNRHMRKTRLNVHEENIVGACADLASTLLDDFKDMIIGNKGIRY